MLLRFTRQAEADILSIHDYTTEKFGTRQWATYENGLRRALENLCDNPHIGSFRGSVRPHTRRLLYQSHAVYYRTELDMILVLRILGIRQDPGRHF